MVNKCLHAIAVRFGGRNGQEGAALSARDEHGTGYFPCRFEPARPWGDQQVFKEG